MSADADFTMTTPALLKSAETYHACPTFHVARDGSRYRCTECEETEAAHIIVALRTALATLRPAPVPPGCDCAQPGTDVLEHAEDCTWRQAQADWTPEREDR